jgi:RNA polymerase sigma factor (sigma-70 family)
MVVQPVFPAGTWSRVMPKIDDRVLLPEVQQKISERARKTVRHRLFSESDYDDVHQDLTWHLHQKLEHYAPDRGDLLAFVHRVVHNRAINLIHERERELPIEGIASRHLLKDTPAVDPESPDNKRLEELRQALAQGVAQLPGEIRTVVEHLESGLTIKAIAEGMGVARSTLIERLRKALRKTEVGEYLKKFRQRGNGRCSEW